MNLLNSSEGSGFYKIVDKFAFLKTKIFSFIGINKSFSDARYEKKKFRADSLEIRVGIPQHIKEQNSSRISELLFSQKYYINCSNIALYYPINGEVDTKEIFNNCIKSNKNIFYPKVIDNSLVFYRVKNLNELIPGYLGIPEPKPSNIHTDDKMKLDLIIVPGLCFDSTGNRLGYGKGFYDKFLTDISQEKIVGLGYQKQIYNSIPVSENDIKVGYLITESGIYDCLDSDGG